MLSTRVQESAKINGLRVLPVLCRPPASKL